MRRAFTLIELLVICAILATMVSIGVGSILSGQGTARVKGATRDVYAAIRHARSVALVTGQRVLVNYSNERVDDETCVKIEVVAAKIMNADGDRPEPQPYYVMEYKELQPKAKTGEKYELVHIRKPGEGALVDPWDNDYRIEIKGKRFVIISNGPDGEPGTEDDIRSDKIEKTKK